MATSRHQKQKLTLSKPRRLARSIVGQFVPLPESPLKRLGIVGAGLITGLGVPALVYASQQRAFTTAKVETTDTSTVTVQATTSSETGEVVPFQGSDSQDTQTGEVTPALNTDVTINGEQVPLENGTVTKHVSGSSSHVDVDIVVDSSASSSTDTSTDISISSHSSSSSGSEQPVRGSPRR